MAKLRALVADDDAEMPSVMSKALRRFVVMTALRDPTLPEQVTSLGARAELRHKPFSIDDLYAALCRCMAHPANEVEAPLRG